MSGFSLPGIYADDQGPGGLGGDYWADQEDADLLRMFEEIDDDAAGAAELQALQARNESLVAAELRSRLRGDARKAAREVAKAKAKAERLAERDSKFASEAEAEQWAEMDAHKAHLDEITGKLEAAQAKYLAEQQRIVAERQAAAAQAADDAMLAEFMAGGDNVVPIQTEAHGMVGPDGKTIQNYITDNMNIEHVQLIPDDPELS